MKKLLVSLLLGAMLLALALPVSAAAGGDILMGTPTVDGKLDDIYKQSVSIDSKGSTINKSGAGFDAPEMGGITYLLYDAKYLYICTVVKDAKVIESDDAYIKEANPWKNDTVENYVDWDGKITAAADAYKVAADGYAKKLYGGTSITGGTAKATRTSDGYIVEIAIPNLKKTGDTIVYGLQINNINAADRATALYLRCGFNTHKLSDKKVTLPVVTTAATTKAAAATTAKAAASTTKAAQTADMSVVVALVSVALSSGAVLSIKKRK